MKFGKFVTFLYLIYETSLYLVIAQLVPEEKSDCTKLYNYLKNDSNDYGNNCCLDAGIQCDANGFITLIYNSQLSVKITDVLSFPSFSRIETLTFVGQNLKEIPENILKLTSLKILDFNSSLIEEIPPAIKNLTQLEEFYISNNNLKELPNEVFNLKHLKILYLDGNNIEVIPSIIQNLSKLESLNLENNNIKKLPSEIFNLPSLKSIDINGNKIEVIPKTINNYSKFEELYIGDNNIKELPIEVFNLAGLKKLDIGDNPLLKTKIIKFGDSTIEHCNFKDVNILCYEPQTCEWVYLDNDIKLTDIEAQNKFNICSKEEIDEIRNKLKNNGDGKSNSFIIIGGVILGCILIGSLVAFILIKKKRSNLNSNDEFRNESIKVVFNKKQINTNDNSVSNSYYSYDISDKISNINNSNDTNGVINNNNDISNNNINSNNNNNNINNNNSNFINNSNIINNNIRNNNNNNINNSNINNNNSNDIINNNTNNNNTSNNNININNNINSNGNSSNSSNSNNNRNILNQNNLNVNRNVILNSGNYNSVALPINLLLISNPQNPSRNSVLNLPLYNNNNNNNNNNIQNLSPTLNKKEMIMNMNTKGDKLYPSSVTEGDEPPPEYTEINKSDIKQIYMDKMDKEKFNSQY